MTMMIIISIRVSSSRNDTFKLAENCTKFNPFNFKSSKAISKGIHLLCHRLTSIEALFGILHRFKKFCGEKSTSFSQL